MGLSYPKDLQAWRAHQQRQHRARALLTKVRGSRRPEEVHDWVLTSGSASPTILLVLDSLSPTSLAAVLRPWHHLPTESVAVLSATGLGAARPDGEWTERTLSAAELPAALTDIRVVASAADYLPVGAATHAWATQHGVPYLIVQHGLMTPLAPPLPPNAHLLAWSQADADFWASGRTDVSATVVGSQLLHDVCTGPRASVDPSATPIYLGQLHGAELPRRDFARAAYRFCRETGATYRPHPSEKDKVSRLIHATWERRGITIDRSGTPLPHVDRPVVSVFSTGVLEAAARGLPAWVDFADPPAWLTDFWDRYGMRPWGGPPTRAPEIASTEPAALIAQTLQAAC